MSFKGFSKAVARLPQLMMTKTGYSEESSDPEFLDLEERLKNFDTYARKLHEDAKKFKDSLSLMLAHQDSFARELKEVYGHISGSASSPGGSGVSPRPSVAYSSSRSIPKETPQASYQGAESFASFSQSARETLLPDLEVIERRLVSPTADLVLVLDQVKRVIVKRGHKLLDYDRHSQSVRKLKEKPDRSVSDEKTLGKYEASFDQAARDFNHINTLLKQQIPVLLGLKVAFIDPCFMTLFWYQIKVHRVLVDGFRSVVRLPAFDLSVSAAVGFEAKAHAQAELLDELTLLAKNRTGLSGSTAMLSGDEGYFSAEVSPAGVAMGSGGGVSPVAPPDYWASGAATAGTVGGDASKGFSGIHQTMAPPSPWATPSPTSNTATTVYVVALYDYIAQAEGDLSFKRDDRIELVEKTANTNDWWTGKLRGVTGVFPGNYVAEM